MTDTELRKITAIDETVMNKDGKNYITVYKLDQTEGQPVELTPTNIREYKRILIKYPSLMRHAKKRSQKLWNI